VRHESPKSTGWEESNLATCCNIDLETHPL